MSDKTGKILEYFPANRQGRIQPDDKGPVALFYLNNVSNPEPEPKKNDQVTFDAPAPRKNKKGKLVQDQATSVTITERAPEPTAADLAREAKRKAGQLDRGRGKKGGRDRRGGRGQGTAERVVTKPMSPNERAAAEAREKAARESRNKRDDKNSRAAKNKTASGRGAKAGKRPARPTSRASTGKGSNAKGSNSAKLSIRAKVRYPSCRDVNKSVLHLEQSNPSLVAQKYIQWPAPVDPKTTGASWRLTRKNQNFFLSRTLGPLYRNYEKKTLPWAAVRARREALVKSLEHAGYHLASEIVRGPWCYGVADVHNVVLDEAALYFDHLYGYPIIPARCLRALLDKTLESPQNSADASLEERATELREVLAKVEVVLLDAMPSGRIQQCTIEQSEMRSAASLLQTASASQLPAVEKKGHAFSLGEDAGFVLTIALRGEGVERSTAQALLGALSAGISSINSRGVQPAKKAEQRLASSILF